VSTSPTGIGAAARPPLPDPYADWRAPARRVLHESFAWDHHVCLPLRPLDTSFLPHLARHRRAGFGAVTVNVGCSGQGVEEHVRMLASLRHWLKARDTEYLLAETAEDLDRARTSGRLAVTFDIEGATAIADQLSLVSLYYDLGVRWMLVAYNAPNLAGGGCQGEDRGLTPFGRAMLREMERVGMQVCLSHTGHRTARDVLAAATKPVIFSHSNPSALVAHPRNIPDDLIRACAATGGVVGIAGVGLFLGNNDASSEVYARHVDHVVQLVGPEHVSIALDYPYDLEEVEAYLAKAKDSFPPALGYRPGIRFVAPEQLEEIVAALLARGYGRAALEAILGGNLRRLAGRVWRPAAARPA
jgi:membrane dipeptidase